METNSCEIKSTFLFGKNQQTITAFEEMYHTKLYNKLVNVDDTLFFVFDHSWCSFYLSFLVNSSFYLYLCF